MKLITASFEGQNIWIQDFTIAYIQEYDLERHVHIKLATQFQLSPDAYPKLVEQLYGIS